MNFLGDYFALGLIIILSMFFFDNKYSLNQASRYFLGALLFTAATAVTDVAAVVLMGKPDVPWWLNMGINTLYFVLNIMATSSIALYLFTRILEHSYNDHCMRNAKVGLTICLVVYAAFLVANFFTGCLFSFGEGNTYIRGPLNAVGYVITIAQMGLVVLCYTRNRKNASSSMRRALLQTFPVAVMCIVIQRIHPQIMLNSFILSMVETVLFLTFQGQRHGVHSLTRLNDRRRFFEDVDGRIKRGERFQVFLINIKNFGVINQKYGHVIGDEILYQFAFALERLLKNSQAFHMNGTVFALTLPYINQAISDRTLGKVLDFMESGINWMDDHIFLDYVTVDHIAEENESDPKEFYEKLEYAAAEAYKLKQRYIRYMPSMGEKMHRRRYLVECMQTIDREHGFQVWYQPIKCLKTGRFCSMEALIRLVEKDGSILSPAEFIPVSEETGMVMPITWFVLEEICIFLSEHPELGDVSVAINLPMMQLLENGFRTHFNSIVDSYGIEHRRISIEFTERAILENFARTKEIMRSLAMDGYRFYLDDFGSGYSNFNCLLQLPFHFIKLDGNLVRMNRMISSDASMVQMITNILHDLEVQVVAEGVENTEQAAELEKQGVDRIQGYVFAKPMPGDKLLEFYGSNPI